VEYKSQIVVLALNVTLALKSITMMNVTVDIGHFLLKITCTIDFRSVVITRWGILYITTNLETTFLLLTSLGFPFCCIDWMGAKLGLSLWGRNID